ncbi:unnamed protein product [Echinostoma caproni]|uniref:RRM domain-containing protein n=1 Tax=Echinostoma caproni TaxID=27848 RepID=A0A183A8X9_9TREM|nr:unnamed protein product [Echinostoma caproni]
MSVHLHAGHQIEAIATPQAFDSSDLLNTSTLSEYTHDSSGFGSLIHDQSGASNLSGYPRSADRSGAQFRWQTHNLTSLESDTSDIGLDQSSMQEPGRSQSPISRTDFPGLTTAVPVKSTESQPQSPLTGGVTKLDGVDEHGVMAFQDTAVDGGGGGGGQQQTVSGRQSRMLEENLASVARYVEELTGCGTSTGAATVVPSKLFKSDSARAQQAPQTPTPVPLMAGDQQTRKDASVEMKYSSPSGSAVQNPSQTTSPSVQASQLAQLQQLNQQLAALASSNSSRASKVNERELLTSAAQELLRRLISNQLPGLFDNATNLPKEIRPEFEDWSVGSGTAQTRTLLPGIPQQQQQQFQLNQPSGARGQVAYGTSLIDAGTSGSAFRQSVNPLISSTLRASPSSTYADLRGSPGAGSGNFRAMPEMPTSGRTQAMDPTLLTNILTQLGLLDNLQIPALSSSNTPGTNTATGTLNTSNAVALLASLLANGQSCMSAGNQNPDSIATSALATLLSNLQASRDQNTGPRPLISRDTQRRPTNQNGRQTELGGAGLVNSLISSSGVSRPMNNLMEELQRLAVPYHQLLTNMEPDIERAANVYRNSARNISATGMQIILHILLKLRHQDDYAQLFEETYFFGSVTGSIAQKSEAAYHWSGKLPVRVYRSMTFSRKVFLGGVPWDSTSEDLVMAFSRFGNVTVSWPQKDGNQYHQGHVKHPSPKGYCYLIYEHESSVSDLLAACVRDPNNGGDYYRISGPEFKSKNVQVIPWVISDSQYTKSGPYRPDTKRTVFIGALHGMITAEALVTIMNDLFGNVVFAALDTDRYKYPIGSGRVAFSSHKSYMRAVTANFVDVRTSKFTKTIQIDPYLEDAYCDSCGTTPGIYFCRAFDCFRYFCPVCWQLWHNSTETLLTHKPLRRTFKPFSDMPWSTPNKY